MIQLLTRLIGGQIEDVLSRTDGLTKDDLLSMLENTSIGSIYNESKAIATDLLGGIKIGNLTNQRELDTAQIRGTVNKLLQDIRSDAVMITKFTEAILPSFSSKDNDRVERIKATLSSAIKEVDLKLKDVDGAIKSGAKPLDGIARILKIQVPLAVVLADLVTHMNNKHGQVGTFPLFSKLQKQLKTMKIKDLF